jgi:hypothetical protein
MKEFFKRYAYDSVKMLLDQVAIAIFGFSLSIAAVKAGNDTLLWVTSVCAVLFYLFLLYGVAWNVGVRHHGTVARGDEKPCWFRGLWISLLANSINLILAVITACHALFSADGGTGAVRGISLLLQGMYIGLLAFFKIGGVALNDMWWSYFLIILPALLISTVGYMFGVKGWHLTNMMMPPTPLSDRPTKQELKERKKEAKEKNSPTENGQS